MTRFSAKNQPQNPLKKRAVCRHGHSLLDGNPNVRVRQDGRRVCRACESSRRATAYQRQLEVKNGVTLPFTLDRIHRNPAIYYNTDMPLLNEYLRQQKEKLEIVVARSGRPVRLPNGEAMLADELASMLRAEIDVVQDVILKRVREEYKPKEAS